MASALTVLWDDSAQRLVASPAKNAPLGHIPQDLGVLVVHHAQQARLHHAKSKACRTTAHNTHTASLCLTHTATIDEERYVFQGRVAISVVCIDLPPSFSVAKMSVQNFFLKLIKL